MKDDQRGDRGDLLTREARRTRLALAGLACVPVVRRAPFSQKEIVDSVVGQRVASLHAGTGSLQTAIIAPSCGKRTNITVLVA